MDDVGDVIRPCPYCGKAGNLYSYQELIDDVVYRYTYCGNCYVRGPRVPCGDGYRDGDETRAWNTMCGGCKPEVVNEEQKYKVDITGTAILTNEGVRALCKSFEMKGYSNMKIEVEKHE